MIRRSIAAVVAFGLIAGGSAQAATIDFATAQDADGQIRHGGVDAHWIVTQWEQNGTHFKLPRNARIVNKRDDDWGVEWAERFRKYPSGWVAPDTQYAESGNFTLTYTFDLTGYDLSTAAFSQFAWSIDDAGSVTLNGHVLASLRFGHWGKMHEFAVPASDLVQGTNVLTITSVNSDYNYEAARLTGALTIGTAQ